MESRWTAVQDRVQAFFPETDGVILSAVIERRDALVRYLAQIHDLTPSEALEGLELVYARTQPVAPISLAAE